MHNPELGFQPQVEEKNEKKKFVLPGKKLLAAFLAISEFFSSGTLAQEKDKIQTSGVIETGGRVALTKLNKQEMESIYKEAGLSLEQIKEIGEAGKGLPLLIQAAAKLADIDPNLVVWVDDKKAFEKMFPDNISMLTDNENQYVKAFCVGTKYPVFINGTSKRVNGDANNYLSKKSAIGLKYIYAATLAHEKVHALGDYSESSALQAQLSFLKQHQFYLPDVYNQYISVLEEKLKNAKERETSLGKAGAHMAYSNKLEH